jgi:hypothetical protein
MDLQQEEQRRRYQRYRVGFGLIALGVGVLFIDSGCHLAWYLTFHPELKSLVTSRWWDWALGTTITWGTLIGSYFLWGRLQDPSWQNRAGLLVVMNTDEAARKLIDSAWQRRAGLLVVMNGIDLVTWVISHSEDLGLGLGTANHDNFWLLFQVSRGLGWAEFMLFASLAAELLAHLGRTEAIETGLAARSLCSIGLVLWVIAFISQTDWAHGWPLIQKPPGPRSFLLFLGTQLLWTIAAFQVTVLSIAACRLSGRAVAKMTSEEEGHELLKSRSEPFDDQRDRWFGQHDEPRR